MDHTGTRMCRRLRYRFRDCNHSISMGCGDAAASFVDGAVQVKNAFCAGYCGCKVTQSGTAPMEMKNVKIRRAQKSQETNQTDQVSRRMAPRNDVRGNADALKILGQRAGRADKASRELIPVGIKMAMKLGNDARDASAFVPRAAEDVQNPARHQRAPGH